MEQIGYSLIKSGNEEWFVGDTYGQCPTQPKFLVIPNGGNHIHLPVLGETYSGYKFVPRYIENSGATYKEVLSDKVIVYRPVEVYTPTEISRRQLFLGLLKVGLINSQEAIAAAQTGAVPASVQTVFNTLPANDQVTAIIAWASAHMIYRYDPFLILLATSQGLTSDQIDQYFREWSVL